MVSRLTARSSTRRADLGARPSKRIVVEEFRCQAIQEAALRVISRRGLAGATMQAIADEAAIAKGTIYLYFASRDELLQRAADHALSRLVETLQEELAAPGRLAERLRALVRTKIEFFEAHREFFRLYLALRYPDGDYRAGRLRRARHPRYRAYLALLGRFLLEAMRRGEARRAQPERLAVLLDEGLNAVILRRLTEDAPAPPPAEDVDWIVATLLNGIAREEGAPC